MRELSFKEVDKVSGGWDFYTPMSGSFVLGFTIGTILYNDYLSQNDTFNDGSYAFFDFFLGD